MAMYSGGECVFVRLLEQLFSLVHSLGGGNRSMGTVTSYVTYLFIPSVGRYAGGGGSGGGGGGRGGGRGGGGRGGGYGGGYGGGHSSGRW